MGMTEASAETTDSRLLPLDVLEGLVKAVPKLVDRTRHQAELARALAGYVPCLSALVPSRADEPSAGRPQPERVDVLTVLGDGVPDLTVVATEPGADDDADGPGGTAASADAGADLPTGTAPAPAVVVVPDESELPVQDYDSLAASQVVPRLATLDPEQLRTVQRYELSHRNRQTILNRVAQLLAE